MSSSAGYLELLRGNRDFRRLWIGDMASLLGDWLNTIALYTLIRQLTGSPVALGLVFIVKTLPFALASPLAGLLADRFDRKRLMIAADLARAVVVLGFLAVDRQAELPLLYGLIALQMMLGAVFVPARSAALPNITSPRELLTANALSAATWSVLLAVGAAIGGFATAGFGTGTVFVLDSASYLVSAAFIAGVRIPHTRDGARPVPVATAVAPLRVGRRVAAGLHHAYDEIIDGWRQLIHRPGIGRMALVKPVWALGGGALVYALTLIGESWRPEAPAVGIGLLFAARGLGTGIGPIAARAGVAERHWPMMFGLGLAVTGLCYLTVGWAAWGLWLPLLVVIAHAPSGANWVASTVLLQKRTPDRFLGRVFATEWLLITLADTLAILAIAILLQTGWATLRQAIFWFAGIEVACGLLWLLTVVPAERRARSTE
jgi:MFS family permease